MVTKHCAFSVSSFSGAFCKKILSIRQNVCRDSKPLYSPVRQKIRACDPNFGREMDSGSEDGTSLFDPADLALLQKRISTLREGLVVKDRIVAKNWKNGTYKTSVVACVPGENFVRRISIDAPLMACGTADGSVCIFHLAKGDRATYSNANAGQTTALAIKGSFVASVGSADQIITVWDISRYRASRDWNIFPGATEDGPVMPSPIFRLAGHTNLITSIEIDAIAKKLYSASLDGSIRIWSLTTGELLQTIHCGEPILCMKRTSKDYILIGCASGRIRAYQATRGLHLLSLQAHEANVTALHFLDDTQTLATGSADGEVKLWSFDTARCIGSPPKHDGAVMALQVDDTKVVSASRDGTVAVNSLKDSGRLYTIEGYTAFISSLVFDDDHIYADGTNNVIASHSFEAR